MVALRATTLAVISSLEKKKDAREKNERDRIKTPRGKGKRLVVARREAI